MMKYTYLIINIMAFLVPFIYSFHPKIQFHKTWKAFFPAVFISAIVFLAGDVLYTHLKVWGFNPDYLMGIYVMNLPLEELLFFFCIPYACMFTYHCLERFVNFESAHRFEKYFTLPLILSLVVFAVIFVDRLYTFAAAAGLAALLAFVKYVYRPDWLGKFYIIYTILLIPFMVVNGLLTGTSLDEPVVWYDNRENIGLRILTIPFEDVFYGMSLILLNVLCFDYFKEVYRIEVSEPV